MASLNCTFFHIFSPLCSSSCTRSISNIRVRDATMKVALVEFQRRNANVTFSTFQGSWEARACTQRGRRQAMDAYFYNRGADLNFERHVRARTWYTMMGLLLWLLLCHLL